jgi:FkbM family methyltransferase
MMTARQYSLGLVLFTVIIAILYVLYVFKNTRINFPLATNHYDKYGRPFRVAALDTGWDERAFEIYRKKIHELSKLNRSRTVKFPIGGLTARVLDGSSHAGFWNQMESGTWELNTYTTLLHLASTDTVVVDVGTWIGPTLLFDGQLASKTYAVEADPAAFAEVSCNLKQNVHETWYNRVYLQAGCLGVESRLLEIRSGGPGNSMSSLNKFYQETPNSVAFKWSVHCYCLPDLFKIWGIDSEYEHVLVKIDIESYECKVLPSLYNWLANMKRKPTIYIAMHSQIVPCSTEEYAAIYKIAALYRYRSPAFVGVNNTIAQTGEFLLSDMKPPI